MRIATITNWAYSATVCLTIASGVVMLMASSADNTERQVVEQRYQFDQLTEEVELDAWSHANMLLQKTRKRLTPTARKKRR